MEGPIFARLAALAERRKELEELSSTPAELRRLSRKELEELRHLARPPRVVRDCLEVVYICLHVEEVSPEIQRLPAKGCVAIEWKAVQAMLARFEGFFPAMQRYDIAPLVSTPGVAEYLGRRYFGEGGLTQGRVQRCSAACGGLFRWCSSSLSRVRAALQLLQLDAEVQELQRPPERWRCETDEGWRDYPGPIHEQLANAAARGSGGAVSFELGGERYEVDLAARSQRNCSSGFVRPVRPPGTTANLEALQGTWRLRMGGLATVRGSVVRMCGELAGEELQVLPAEGVVAWDFLDGRWLAEGDPLRVVWRLDNGKEEVTWEPAAKQRATPLLPPLPVPPPRQPPEETPRAADTVRSSLASPLTTSRSVYRAEGAQERWVCKVDRGWAEYPADVDELLRGAQERGGGAAIEFEIDGQRYKADLTTRIQRNLTSGFMRPIRPPPGESVNITTLQGLWDARSSGVAKIRVKGAVVFLDGQESAGRLESKALGVVQWRFGSKLLCASGTPLQVVWKHEGDQQMAWTPTARA